MRRVSSMVFLCLLIGIGLQAADDSDKATVDDFLDLSLEELLQVEVSDEKEQRGLIFYGFLRGNAEQVFSVPQLDANGQTVKEDESLAYADPELYFFGKSFLTKNISLLFNLFGTIEDIEVQNAWGNFKLPRYGEVRFGKMYRRFGLYNEKLIEFPVFVGIEAPELFDQDHLLLPRFVNLAYHGETEVNKGELSWWIDSGNGESGPEKDVFPMGFDVRWEGNDLLFGASYYTSSITGSETKSDRDVGEGSPRGGVLPWMAGDSYDVAGGFIKKRLKNFVIEAAYWRASHDATRDPGSVLQVIANADLNPRQRERFLGDAAGLANEELTLEDVEIDADYDITTNYVRLFYNAGKYKPYLHYDFMDNPETIASKTWGGDNESGVSDDGEFQKWSLGLVYNPIEKVAIKVDTSIHVQDFNGVSETYSEVRFDLSWAFNLNTNK